MLLEELIHAFWRNSPKLAAVVPEDRFITGPVENPPIPGVVLLIEKNEVLCHTNRKEPWKKITLQYDVHCRSYEEGSDIAALIEEQFDRLRLHDTENSTSRDDERIYRFKYVRGETRTTNKNTWIFSRRFEVFG